MNLFLVTVQVITQPRIVKINNNNFLVMSVGFPNNKRNISFARLYIFFNSSLIFEVFNLYKKKSFMILQGHINIKKKKVFYNDYIVKYRKENYIEVNIYKIQPYIIHQYKF